MARIYCAFLLIFAIISCNKNEIFTQYKSIDNELWHKNQPVEFNFENTDNEVLEKNVFINLRNTNDYPYKTIFLIGKIEFPSGKTKIDTLEYEMADEYGNWLGTGISAIKENKLYYAKHMSFKENGLYKFTIQQATRSIDDVEGKNPLPGITSVGLSIEKK